MRALRVIALVAAAALLPSLAFAQEADALRRELEQIRKQFETVQQEYQRAMQQMSERLQRLEARPQSSAPTPAVVQAPPGGAPTTLMDLARPRPPFALSKPRGAGQFLFDMGIAGDFVATLTRGNADTANAGTFAGRENRLFPREIELSFFGQIDPYARGEVRIEAAEEFEDGERENHIGLSEAHLTLLTLPLGTQAKIGLMRNRFGLLNERHQHDLPQIDRPNALVRFFGEEQLVESGAELSWLAPLPFYLQALVGVFNGDNEEAFGRGSITSPLVTGRLRTFFELGDTSALQLGVSVASGDTDDERRNTILGGDVKFKLTPAGFQHALLTLAAEAVYGRRSVDFRDDDGIRDDRTRYRAGWYTYAEVQPFRRWAFGARYDWTQFPVEPGREWAVQPYIAFMPSEFLRFRLGYKHTERTHRVSNDDGLGSGRRMDELLFQATFILGAHPAHPF